MAIPLYRGSAGADGAACCGTEILQPYLAGGEGGLMDTRKSCCRQPMWKSSPGGWFLPGKPSRYDNW